MFGEPIITKESRRSKTLVEILVNVQKINVTSYEKRVETGPICFFDSNGPVDWPGTFIRGDCSFGYKMALKSLLERAGHSIYSSDIEELIELLDSCNAQNQTTVFPNQ